MVQSNRSRFFLAEKKLLQLQLHLCAGDGTFQETETSRQQSEHASVFMLRAQQQDNSLSLPFSLFLSSSSCCSSLCFSCSSCRCCSSFLFCSNSCCLFAASSSCCCFNTHMFMIRLLTNCEEVWVNTVVQQ